jgi:predicted transcriptional regulator
MIMKNYVSDELTNKVYHLAKALNSAEEVIETLEKANDDLKDAFNNLASLNNEDYTVSNEDLSEQLYAA